MKPTKRDVLAGTYGDITAINYARLLRFCLTSPPRYPAKEDLPTASAMLCAAQTS